MKNKLHDYLINRFEYRYIIQFIIFLFLMIFLCGQANAIDFTLSWDGNSEPDIAGYKVYYKANSSGQPAGDYDNIIDVGNVTTRTLEGLEEGVVYYFAVTAYDTSGLESDFSNEISTLPKILFPDIGTTPHLMTAGNDPDSVALYADGGSIQGGFNWSLSSGSVGSIGEITNERTVIYSAPLSIEGDSSNATLVLKNDAGTVLGQQDLIIYKAVTITTSLTSDQGIYPGEDTTFTVQGGDGSYTWTVKKDGNLVDIFSGTSYLFNPVGAGAAGIYSITVTDGNYFTDSFSIDVWIEDRNDDVPTSPGTYDIPGPPDDPDGDFFENSIQVYVTTPDQAFLAVADTGSITLVDYDIDDPVVSLFSGYLEVELQEAYEDSTERPTDHIPDGCRGKLTLSWYGDVILDNK